MPDTATGKTSASLQDYLGQLLYSKWDANAPFGSDDYTRALSAYAREKGLPSDWAMRNTANPGDDFKAWNAARTLAPYGGDVNRYFDETYGPAGPGDRVYN